MSMHRSPMDLEANREKLAKMYAEGAKRSEMADEFGVNPSTVSGWTKRPDVQALVTKFVQERTNKILRHTDTRIESILNSGKDLELDDLLRIRKEFGGSKVEVTTKDGDKAGAMTELMERIHNDPTLLERLVGAAESADES